MNDALKCQVFKIYFEHWGLEEIKLRRRQHGIKSTMDKIKTLFIDDNDFATDFDFVQEVAMMDEWVHYQPESAMDFLINMVNVLLSDMGGCVRRSIMPKSKQWSLADRFGISVRDVYMLKMNEDDVRSVDAIVAL